MKFNINSPVFQFLTMLADFILLNIIFLITCLPVFTIGASITSLYYVTMQEAREDHGYIVRNYIKAFKQNFVQATVIWFIFAVIGSVILFNLFFWYGNKSILGNIVFTILIIGSAIFIICFLYVFPLLARFQNSIKQTMQNALLLSLQNFKITILLILLNGLFVFLCWVLPWSKVFMLLLGFAFFAYCNSFLFIRVFKKYEPEDDIPEIDKI